jgi:predicted RNA-binding protein
MCEAHAYLVAEAGQDKVMDNVVRIGYDDDGQLVLTDLFGDELRLDAKIREIALIEHKIYLETNA